MLKSGSRWRLLLTSAHFLHYLSSAEVVCQWTWFSICPGILSLWWTFHMICNTRYSIKFIRSKWKVIVDHVRCMVVWYCFRVSFLQRESLVLVDEKKNPIITSRYTLRGFITGNLHNIESTGFEIIMRNIVYEQQRGKRTQWRRWWRRGTGKVQYEIVGRTPGTKSQVWGLQTSWFKAAKGHIATLINYEPCRCKDFV